MEFNNKKKLMSSFELFQERTKKQRGTEIKFLEKVSVERADDIKNLKEKLGGLEENYDSMERKSLNLKQQEFVFHEKTKEDIYEKIIKNTKNELNEM